MQTPPGPGPREETPAERGRREWRLQDEELQQARMACSEARAAVMEQDKQGRAEVGVCRWPLLAAG